VIYAALGGKNRTSAGPEFGSRESNLWVAMTIRWRKYSMSKPPSRFLAMLITALLATGAMQAQTKLNLQSQSQDVDFSAAPSTKPAQTGTTLPSACSPGAVFLLLNNAPGKNLYVCTGPDTWTQQTGGGAAPDVAAVSDTVLSVGANCSADAPCNVRLGATIFAFIGGVTATLSGGTGTAYIYVSSAGLLTVGHNLTVTCALGCVAQSGITDFPPDSYPIAIWNATNGAWSQTGTDVRASSGRDLIAFGSGISGTVSPGVTTLSVPPQKGGFSVAFRGTDVAAGETIFVTVPYACTITDWAITSDGTATIMLWSSPDGTPLPTDSDALTEHGLSLTTGSRIHSTTLTDFVGTSIFAFDTIGVNLAAVGGSASHVELSVGCTR
jgi:hypothetical protein